MPTNRADGSFDLETTYVVLADGPAATRVEVGPDFWQTIDRREDVAAGRLVGSFRYDADWQNWEMHPEGDELVCLLSGAVDLVLEEPGRERVVALRDGATVIVPRGVWHTANVVVPGAALHVTRGKGTQHRPR